MSVPEWVQLLMWPATVFLSVYSLARAICTYAKQKRKAAECASDGLLERQELLNKHEQELLELKNEHEENLRWFEESCRNGIWLPVDDARCVEHIADMLQICGAKLSDDLTYVYLVPKDLGKRRAEGSPVPRNGPYRPADRHIMSGQMGSFDFASRSGQIGTFDFPPRSGRV